MQNIPFETIVCSTGKNQYTVTIPINIIRRFGLKGKEKLLIKIIEINAYKEMNR